MAAVTSWRRFSDGRQKHAAARGACSEQTRSRQANEAQQVATWENEGGRSALSTNTVRILIVDDDIESSTSLELMLRTLGYSETCVAYSGHAALAIAADFQPCMVLLELGLPDISGCELGRMLRERAKGHDLRLIALTSSREQAARERARMVGFARYFLLKPVGALDLARLVADATGSR